MINKGGMPKKLREKLVPLPLCPPRDSHDDTLDCTQGFAAKGERLASFNYGAGF
jgi:hypothetical protein